MLVLGPVAGVVIDRFSRKRMLIVADVIRAALALSLVWPQGVWHAYAVAFGLAAGNVFFGPALNAVIPVLTTEDQRLAANSVSWSTSRFVQILAASVAGGLIALVGTAPAFALNAASFAFSAALIATLEIPAHPLRRRPHRWSSMPHGTRQPLLRRTRRLRFAGQSSTGPSMLATPYVWGGNVVGAGMDCRRVREPGLGRRALHDRVDRLGELADPKERAASGRRDEPPDRP